jgi:hypothetical protein
MSDNGVQHVLPLRPLPPSDIEVLRWLRDHPIDPITSDPKAHVAHAAACHKAFPGITPGQYSSLFVMLMVFPDIRME